MSKSNKVSTVLSLFLALGVILSVVFGAVTKEKPVEIISAATVEGLASAKELRLTAHRGFSAVAPENSLAAIRLAGENGFYGCEFDIHTTADGKWVVMHDGDIGRTTNGKGNIAEMTLEELSAFTLDKGNGLKEYPNEKIPTLEQVLDVCAEYEIRPIIELKGGESKDIEGLSELLKDRGFVSKVVIISFNGEYLSQLHRLNPDLELWYLVQEITEETIDFCRENGIKSLDFNHKNEANYDMLSKVTEAGLFPSAWTVDDPHKAAMLSERGVSFITSNRIKP